MYAEDRPRATTVTTHTIYRVTITRKKGTRSGTDCWGAARDRHDVVPSTEVEWSGLATAFVDQSNPDWEAHPAFPPRTAPSNDAGDTFGYSCQSLGLVHSHLQSPRCSRMVLDETCRLPVPVPVQHGLCPR